MSFALQQIAGWQTARKKLPSWAAVDDVAYPPHLNMEQCSSEQTARYKEQVVRKLFPEGTGRLVDLTGGLGVDFSLMARPFRERVYVERQPGLCDLARHNFPLLGLDAEVVCADAETYLRTMDPASVIFLDPARRDEHGGRTYSIEDCTPNVIELLPLLKKKSDRLILKLSPMLDWRKAVADLGNVQEVHIVSVDNECKELLLVMGNVPPERLQLTCVNNDSVFEVVPTKGTPHIHHGNDQELFLYEPNASIMKAGCFRELAETYGVSPLSANSHLFVSGHEIDGFPGRRFQVEARISMNKQEVRQALKDIKSANIAVRNFPISAEALRKKLRLRDGGDVFIFGTTLSDNAHKLFICRKIG